MEKYEIQKLRELPIEAVAERLGLEVQRHKCLCPFHDDHHASLTFNVRRNAFRCFVCNAHGGTVDLVMQRLGKDFPDACRWLADGTNVILTRGAGKRETQTPPLRPFDATRYERFFLRPWLSEEARRWLFDERRLDARVVRWCRLTSWRDREGVGWLQIPYYDAEGNLVGIQNRNLTPGVSATAPRFRFPYGARCGIYNLPVLRLLGPGEPLYITEGCSDCWAMLSSGHKAIAIPSATLLCDRDVGLLQEVADRRGTTFHMYPDRDTPGELLFLELRRRLPGLLRHELLPGCKDYAEMFVRSKQP